MNKKMLFITLTIVLVVIIVICAYYIQQSATSPDYIQQKYPTLKNGTYLNLRGGEKTRMYLIDSYVRYGNYEKDVMGPPGTYLAKKGDACVILNGTIRNDYNTDIYIGLTAEIYNASGQKVGSVININNTNMPGAPFITIFTKSKSVESFEIYIKYDKADISGYDIFVAFEPSATAPP
ncbi:hypothetical protein Mtc_2456 [Methanocella conradii HZ254]|uniref:Uncharacterized protein n=1 Tax=Methanocella conradii (strain DSM 24694 / JCM 17849 / CGMCC 1.5162 / HZ254) TaxID=1041930 RepID=H8I7H2_METCZ|nr:hypothetical protein [Methanocella conradii]AFD01182.1 hypothetical protein Mtc_2456 [Methanocella conradii HZ254]